MRRAQQGDERGQGRVDAAGEEDGGDDDEEVGDYEVDHAVGIAGWGRGGEEAEGVACGVVVSWLFSFVVWRWGMLI